MRKQTLPAKVLRCYSDNFLCCGALTRCKYPSSPCDYHRISRRRFGSTRPRLRPDGAAAGSDEKGDQNGTPTTTSWRSANWGGPTFKREPRDTRLTGEELKLRESLAASQKPENQRGSTGNHVRFVSHSSMRNPTSGSESTASQQWGLNQQHQYQPAYPESQSQTPRQQRQSDGWHTRRSTLRTAFPRSRSLFPPDSSSQAQPSVNGRPDAHPSQIRHPMYSSVLRVVRSGAHAASGQGQGQGFSAQHNGQLGTSGNANSAPNPASSHTSSMGGSDPSSVETDMLSILEKPLHPVHRPAVQRQGFSAQLNGRLGASVSANGSPNSASSHAFPGRESDPSTPKADTPPIEKSPPSAPRQPTGAVGSSSEPKSSNDIPENDGQQRIDQNQLSERKYSPASARETSGMFKPATPLGWAAPHFSARPGISSVQSPTSSESPTTDRKLDRQTSDHPATSNFTSDSLEPETPSGLLDRNFSSAKITNAEDNLGQQSRNPSNAPERSDRPSGLKTPFGLSNREFTVPESTSRQEKFNQQTSNQRKTPETSEMPSDPQTLSGSLAQESTQSASLNSQGDLQSSDQPKAPETSDDHSKPKTLSGWSTPRFGSHSATSSGWSTPRFRSRSPTLTSWESSQREGVVNTEQPPAEQTYDQAKTPETSSSNREKSSKWTTHGHSQHTSPDQNRNRWDKQRFRKHPAREPRQSFDPGAYNQPHFPNFRPVLENPGPQLSKEDHEVADAKDKVNAVAELSATEIDDPVDEEDGEDFNSQSSNKQNRKVEYVDHKKLRQQFKSNKSLDFNDDEDRSSYKDGFDNFDDTSRRGRRKGKGKNSGSKKAAASEEPTPIYLPEFISVSSLADALSQRKATFLKRIQDLGFEDATYDHVLDAETAGLIAAEFNFEPVADTTVDDLVAAPVPDDASKLAPRPPVVTIMGHVDHGKTTILDWLRKSSVAASEHGGITQHIGAFSVKMSTGKMITFLDTPGHAAFLDMRRRGADVTDIVILVIAADDSVKPQTLEAIKHANEAQVPIIVAISKIDKPEIDVERVKQDLARHGVNVEDIGGDVQTVGVSGKTGQGMQQLEEAAVTLAEMLELRADTSGNAEGWVVEASTQKGGRVATVLVRRGTLRPGSVVVAGKTWARIRNLRNEAGVQVQEAPPGTPVAIDGWREQPIAGDEVLQAESEQRAKEVVELRLEREETQKMGGDMQAINEARRIERVKRHQALTAEEEGLLGEAAAASEQTDSRKTIPFIVKADVSGSVEAVVNSISAIGSSEVYPTILRASAGKVSEFDIKHASVAKGTIVTFNERTDQDILKLAAAEGVDVVDHTIIYELIDDVKARLSEKLAPNVIHRVLGEAEVAQVFEYALKRRETTLFAGCRVTNGIIARSHTVKVLRKGEVVYDGSLSSLKNVKKDVTEMRKGTECGIGFDNWADFQVGDQIQTYEEIREQRCL